MSQVGCLQVEEYKYRVDLLLMNIYPEITFRHKIRLVPVPYLLVFSRD